MDRPDAMGNERIASPTVPERDLVKGFEVAFVLNLNATNAA